MYNGENILVGNINCIKKRYVYTDLLFENINPVKKTFSLENLNDLICEYYNTKDTIGKIEQKYPYLF